MSTQSLKPYLGQKKAVVYIRVSSEEQVENYSLGTQEEICRREAKFKGYEVLEVFREEGRSAKTIIGRPELLSMLDYCRKNKKDVQAVFVYRLDRLSRQTQDYLALRKRLFDYGIAIISATEPTGNSPTETMFETILASFAQHDNDVRSERTKNGMRARFLSGLVTNHVPLGYMNQGGYALKDPQSFDTIKKAWDLMATGTTPLRGIAKILTEQKVTYKGRIRKIKNNTVQRMFRNKFYIGILTSPNYPEEVKGQHIPMVTEEQFYKVQAILDGRNVSTPIQTRKGRDNSDFPLRRIVQCGKCGAPFTGAWSKGTSIRYGYYFCRNRCITTSITIKNVSDGVKDHLTNVKPTEAGLKLYITCLLKTYNQKLLKLNKTKVTADETIQKLLALRQILVEKNLAGTYSDEIFKEQNSVIESKLIAAHASKNDALISQYDIDKISSFVKAKFSDLAKTFGDTKSLIVLRCLFNSIFLSGLSWDYPGISNQGFSPCYQAIRDCDNGTAPFGDPTGIRIPVLRMRI